MVYHDVFAPFWFEEDRASEPMHYKQGAIEQAAVVTTWTEHSAAVFRQQFPQHAHKMRVVPPYLSRLVHCFLPPSQKLELRKETSEVRFVFVGTDARRKGLEPVLAAWLRLTPALRRHAHLTVCSSLADGEVKIPADVEHRGYEPDVPAVLKRSDVFVMPSRRESFGLVFPEAAAAGCAIIATDDATRRSMLPATGTAFVRPTESEQIAEAMRRCIEDRMYLHTAQQAQYEHALKTWEPRRVADLHYGAFQAANEMAESAEVLRSA
jgi:glycosyltransferase involved in cell wall biosynthesis